ncbi:hypothetical protein F4861DRAFT_528603 [Xylaria intraflava]|nr:hypothetical protein F4861DRAFT_528603 [Xylaria intraflava]
MNSKARDSPEFASFEAKIGSTVNTIIEIAFELGSSLAALERNTREIFWWTSWTIGIVLGLFILHLLVRVRTQLVQLNDYQAVFQRMWTEDRATEDRIRREERRERHIREMQDASTRREDMEAVARARAQTQAGSFGTADLPTGNTMVLTKGLEARVENYLDEALDGVGPVPERDTLEYEEFLDQLRSAMQRGRR